MPPPAGAVAMWKGGLEADLPALAERPSQLFIAHDKGRVFIADAFLAWQPSTLNPTGQWDSATTYKKLDLAKSNGAQWLALRENTNVAPVEGLDWTKFIDKGDAGPTGPMGFAVLNGSGVPSGGTGQNGDFYINTAANTIYGPKAAGAWGAATSLVGPQGIQGTQGIQGVQGNPGADGKTVLNGSGAPASGTGNNGDFYVDTTAKAIYGPKTSGTWGSPTSLVGPQGPSGLPPAPITVSSNYTALTSNYGILVDATGGNVTISLPTVAGIVGQEFYIQKVDLSANSVIVDPAGTETITLINTPSPVTTATSTEPGDVIRVQAGIGGWLELPVGQVPVVTSTAPFSDATPIVKDDADATKKVRIEASGVATGTTRVITMPNQDVDLGALAPFSDATALIKDNTDATRQVRVEAGGLATGTTRVITMPDRDVDLANVSPRSLVLYNGDSPLVANQNETGEYPITANGTITRIVARVATAPTGSAITVSIKKNGTQITTVTIAAGSKTTNSTGLSLSVVDGDYLTMVPTAVGSTVAGAKLSVTCLEILS